jgi:predicted TIM-barrel fold metal-dependent hydrolase
MNRRSFVGALPLLPVAAGRLASPDGLPRITTADQPAAQVVQAPQGPPAFPVIDTHIHIYDKTRPGGAPYPRDVPGGGEPPQGMVALPNRYKAIVSPFGVVGAIIVEASPRLEDNQWCLDVSASHPIIVGLVGRLDPADAAFAANLERLVKNPLFIGIRQGQLHLGLDSPAYIANLRRLADADCSLDVDTPRQGMTAAEVLVKVLDKVPSVRLVMDHLPDVRFPDHGYKERYVRSLRELAARPNVYIKLSEVVRRYEGRVMTDLHFYRAWLDELWDLFGEDRIIFGSDWPQSEMLEFNSYPNVFGLARAFVMSRNPAAMEKVFWRNSRKPYRWVQREPSQRQS